MVAGAVRQRELRVADGAELGSVAERLLEVVAGDLRVLGDSVAGGVVDPVGEALVKLRPQALRGRSVSRLLDQDVTEAKAPRPRPGAGAGAMNSLRARVSRCGAERARVLGQEVERGLAENSLPTMAAREITARSPGPSRSRRADSSACDRRRNRELCLGAIALRRTCDELLDEEWVSLGGLEHACLVAAARPSSEVADQRLALRVGKALEHQGARVRPSAAPAGSLLEQLGTGDADEEDRDTLASVSARYSTRSRKVGSAQ